MSRDNVSSAELHRIFMARLAREAPGSVFVFEIDGRAPDGDGCNWYPLASMGAWQGDLNLSLAAFRRVRESLARDYNLAEADDPVAAAEARAGAAAA